MKLSDLSGHPGNPRKASDKQLEMLKHSLAEFGDMGCVVFNINTRRLIGGHQRIKVLPPDAEVKLTRTYPAPTSTGTVAEGNVIIGDESFKYREVSWDETKEKAANIAANKHGGEWDFPKLAEFMLELDAENYDLDLTGFTAPEIEDIMTYSPNASPEYEKATSTATGFVAVEVQFPTESEAEDFANGLIARGMIVRIKR